MHVIERGTGAPLVLVHGFTVDHRILLGLDPVFDAAGDWRRLYIDLPGHGLSPADGATSTEGVVAAVEAELRRRIGDEPFAIVGNSFGGMVARRIAHDLRGQVLGLATIAGVFIANHAERTTPARTVVHEDAAVLRDLAEAAADYAEMAVVHSAANAQSFLTHVAPGLALADVDAVARISEDYTLDVEPEDASPDPFTQPSLFLTARQDHVVGYVDAWARIEHYPRGTFAALDAAGHNVHLDRPGVAEALIADWLERVAMAGRATAR